MSVLIKSMDMPRSCHDCPLRTTGGFNTLCLPLGVFVDRFVKRFEKRPECPLVNVAYVEE